jgi:hypothetical protein
VVDYRSEGSWFAPSLCNLVFSGHGELNVKLRTLEYITLYLRNRQSGNLRAIESCVCSIRSIERNMMSFSTDSVQYCQIIIARGPSVSYSFSWAILFFCLRQSCYIYFKIRWCARIFHAASSQTVFIVMV